MEYSIKDIPAWIIRKQYRDCHTVSACILAIDDGTAAFVHETEKALLFDWSNQSLMACRAAGGRFWVPKSVLARR